VNTRIAQLLAPEDLGAAGTKVIGIDIDQPISRILIRFTTTKSKQGMDAPAPANISRIEIVDGSAVIFSLTGYECQALAYYNHPGVTMEHGQHINALSETDLYMIDFGRELWDETLAFLASRFTNPQLRITWDEDVADTGVSANECEILAFIFDEKQISPTGFLSAQEWFDYTVGANNSFEPVRLPEDHIIRQVLVRAYRDGYEPWAQIDEIRLDENNLQRVPFEYTNLENYYRMMKDVWKPLNTPTVIFISTGSLNFYYPQTDFWMAPSLMLINVDGNLRINGLSAKGGKLPIIAPAAAQAVGQAFGYLPWHTFQFPMGTQDQIEDWYDPTGKRPRLRLRAASSGTSGTGQVVLEQYRRY